MEWSRYQEVNTVIDRLMNAHKDIFHDKMVGYYLYGSLIWGDFDISTSDIDTLCVLSSEVTEKELKKLRMAHESIVNEFPKWSNRIEVHYAPKNGLMQFKASSFRMGNISPGESLHMIDAGVDWIDEWYCVQEYAITLLGCDKAEVLPHIETEEFIEAVCRYARSFKERIRTCRQSSYSQAYAILTLCRALYTLKNQEQVSKPAAANWAMEYLPEYSDTIRRALLWRKERDLGVENPSETYQLAQKFVDDVLNRFF